MLGVVLVSALVKWHFPVLAQDKSAILHGLQGCCVVVERLEPEIELGGLTKEQLQTDTEVKLRMAGIKVYSLKEATQVERSRYFYLNVNVIKLRSGCYEYDISTELIEEAFPLWETTWTQLAVLGRSCRLSDIRRDAEDMVEMFVNEYLAANSK